MEKCHLIWIFLLTSTYLLAWNIQMKEIQIKNEKKSVTKINVVEVPGWPPTRNRNIREYIKPQENTALILPKIHSVNQTFVGWHEKIFPSSYVLVVVHSALDSFAKRQSIRQSWARDQTELPIKVIFILGKPQDDQKVHQEKVQQESQKNSDLLQEDFLDSYANLTLKSMFMLKFALDFGAKHDVKYVMKVDDDSYVHLPRLMSYISIMEKRCQNCIVGHVLGPNSPVIRPKSQTKKYADGWEVPNYIYKPDTFPNAVSGSGYIISSSILNCIYQQGLDTSYINLEDIFITGLSASKCNATLKNSPWFNFTGKKMSRIRAQDVLIHNVRNDSDLHLIYKKLH